MGRHVRRPQPLGHPPGPWYCPGAGRPLPWHIAAPARPAL